MVYPFLVLHFHTAPEPQLPRLISFHLQVASALQEYRPPLTLLEELGQHLGRSIPTDLFNPVCNVHDICYETSGRSKLSCDQATRDSLVSLCAALFAHPPTQSRAASFFCGVYNSVRLNGCNTAAQVVYDGIRSAFIFLWQFELLLLSSRLGIIWSYLISGLPSGLEHRMGMMLLNKKRTTMPNSASTLLPQAALPQ